MTRSNFRLLTIISVLTLFACSNDEAPATSVTLMTFNVQNLFDNLDDPGKDDKAYLPIEAKRNDAHIAECMEIEVKSWRDECLDLDWSDAVLDHKLSVLANTIKQIDETHVRVLENLLSHSFLHH